jgi:acyl-coenzyme A synthetase/AMP-(fatty) acid ligase
MNGIKLFVRHAKASPQRTALWMPDSRHTSFGELMEMACKVQGNLIKQGIEAGDAVLVFDTLGPRLFSSILAIVGLGCHAIFAEPWMPLPDLNYTIATAKPKFFLTNFFGRLWALRVAAIRAIPHWIGFGNIQSVWPSSSLHIESISPNDPAIITFTSGTTGTPKGVVRTQQFLVDQQEIISKTLYNTPYHGPDLCVFANYALTNLLSGRCTLLIPPNWNKKMLSSLDDLPINLQPDTLTCGPAFLMQLMKQAHLPTLQSIHVGGALTDCWIFEKAFQHWPHARWSHIYGSSEAEPITVVDAHLAVKNSRERGFFQTLHLGKAIDDIETSIEEQGLWVTGKHVCPQYVGNYEANTLYKRVDQEKRTWHFMGDRIIEDQAGWWYGGRAQQNYKDFTLEQKIYNFLGSSASFIHRTEDDRLFLIGEKLNDNQMTIKKMFKNLTGIIEGTIYRDERHHAQINRPLSLRKCAKWLIPPE